MSLDLNDHLLQAPDELLAPLLGHLALEVVVHLVAAGAGRTLLPGDVDPETIRRGLVDVLGDDALRTAARRLRDELDAMPQPAAAVARIETLV